MSGKYKKLSEQTRQNFIDAFWQLYEKFDITAIRVQQICDIAGYHRNTFYKYFENIYDILNQVENKIIDELIANSDEKMFVNEKGNTAAKFAKIYEKNKRYLKVLANNEKNSNFYHKLIKNLRPFYDKKFLFSSDEEKNNYLFEYRLAGTVGLILDCFKNEDISSIEERLTIIIELATTGKWPIQNK